MHPSVRTKLSSKAVKHVIQRAPRDIKAFIIHTLSLARPYSGPTLTWVQGPQAAMTLVYKMRSFKSTPWVVANGLPKPLATGHSWQLGNLTSILKRCANRNKTKFFNKIVVVDDDDEEEDLRG